MLTLSTTGRSVEAEVAGRRRNRARWPSGGRKKTRTETAIHGFPARLPGPGRRRGRGGGDGVLGLPWGSSSRRRCGGGARLGHGHGAAASRVSLQREKKRGRRSRWSRRSFLSSRGGGGQARGGCGGGATATAIVAAVLPLSPQLKMVLTVGTPCQCFNLFFSFPSLFPVAFRDLSEASNHLLKFCKYSSGVRLTCRAYPKIGVAI